MTFKEKYTTKELKAKDSVKEKDKTEVSNDAYALGDVIQTLISKLEQTRLSLIK